MFILLETYQLTDFYLTGIEVTHAYEETKQTYNDRNITSKE